MIRTTCSEHGAVILSNGKCQTDNILALLREHRAYQYARYGSNRDTADGVGSNVSWIPDLPWMDAAEIEEMFRDDWDYDRDPSRTQMTWLRIVREEVAEAFAADDHDTLVKELFDVAALCVSWLEQLASRQMDVQTSITDEVGYDRAE